jgi:predicted TIM-barrel fold metal-dependent hydrolase
VAAAFAAIDFHTHVQPDAAGGIAFQQRFGCAQPRRTGTPEELLPLMDACGIERVLMVPWMPAQDHVRERLASRPGQQEAVRAEVLEEWRGLNQWAVDCAAKHPQRLACLVGLDPILMDPAGMREEVRDKLGKGAVGLKIAPLFLDAAPSDERVAGVFELAAEHGVFVLSQAGANGYGPHADWGHPRYFDAVLRAFPQVPVQLAHLGLGAEDEVARLTARHPNLYADTSARLHLLGRPGEWSLSEAADWLRRIGIDRVLFGTNYPMHEPAEYLAVMRALPLSETEREQILHRNARRLLQRTGR